jgi:hypothetical protein
MRSNVYGDFHDLSPSTQISVTQREILQYQLRGDQGYRL